MAAQGWRSAGTGINEDIDATTIWMIGSFQTNDQGGECWGAFLEMEARKPEQQSCLSKAPRKSACCDLNWQ